MLMKRFIFLSALVLLTMTGPRALGQTDPEIAYPTVERWLKDNKIAMAENVVPASLEKALLNNIRLAFIENGISAGTYQDVLKEVILEFYKTMPEPSDERVRALLGNRDYLLKYISLKGPRPQRTLRDTRLPTVRQWLVENDLVLFGTWNEAHWEMALLHNLRLVALVNDIPQETYRSMLKDSVLPILKAEKPSKSRGAALKAVRDMLYWSFDAAELKPAPANK